MSSSLRKVSLLIIAIIVVPIVIFSVFEIGNYRQNEKVIQDIYKNQLEAILFSINQYSDDIISNLASRIENSTNKFKSDTANDLSKIINEMPAFIGIVQFDNKQEKLSAVPSSFSDNSVIAEMVTYLANNSKTIKQLQSYMESGYRKIEPIGNASKKMQWIVFLTHPNEREVTNILVIDPEKFISQVLDPKIQEIAKGKFDIAAYRSGEDLPFYTAMKKISSRKISDREPFWLFTNYLMGIELKDITIADLTKERVKRNLIIIGLMDFILLSGAWLIFRNVKKQLELSQLKNDFVSNVSHEIRTPLALIRMYIETLEMGRVKNDEKIKEYYTIILNETTRLSGIVNRILNFSQIEGNKRKYYLSETDLNEVVENAAITFRYSIETKGFVYSFEPDKNLPPVMADREAVTDAFVNLVDNAMKYSPGIKEIAVRTGSNGKYVYIEVEDHGLGISDKDQKYIFDKFYRVTETNLANKVKGSGLGLAIVKHIMDAHAGKIYVKSAPGSGSQFRLSFPIKQNNQS
jgi:two-component system, OmpR family, phosphate regulon sensor histidine kinase PhoR